MRIPPHVDAVARRRCRRDDTSGVSSLGRGVIQPARVVLWCAARRGGCRRREPPARRLNPRYHHRRRPLLREDHTRETNDVLPYSVGAPDRYGRGLLGGDATL